MSVKGSDSKKSILYFGIKQLYRENKKYFKFVDDFLEIEKTLWNSFSNFQNIKELVKKTLNAMNIEIDLLNKVKFMDYQKTIDLFNWRY